MTRPAGDELIYGSDGHILAAGLAEMIDGIPQILRQASAWLEAQAMTGKLLVDDQVDAGGEAALTAAAKFDEARAAAVTLSRLLHDAQRTLSVVHSP